MLTSDLAPHVVMVTMTTLYTDLHQKIYLTPPTLCFMTAGHPHPNHSEPARTAWPASPPRFSWTFTLSPF